MKDKECIVIAVPKEMKTRFTSLCKKKSMTKSTVIKVLINKYLDSDGNL